MMRASAVLTGLCVVLVAPAQAQTGFGNVPANQVVAGPTSGSAAPPAPRVLVPADIPASYLDTALCNTPTSIPQRGASVWSCAAPLTALGTIPALNVLGNSTGSAAVPTAFPIFSTANAWTGPSNASVATFNTTTTGTITTSYGTVQINHTDAGVYSNNTTYVYPLLVSTVLNNTAIQGIRPGATFQLIFSQRTANTNPALGLNFYVATSSVAVAGAPDNGVIGAPLGYLYGANPAAQLNAGATNWRAVVGMDVIAGINSTGAGACAGGTTNACAQRRVGVALESQGNQHGTVVDAALDVFGPSFQWNTGLLFDDTADTASGAVQGAFPIAAGGTLIKGGVYATTSVTLANGADFSMNLFSGCSFKGPGQFCVDGNGDVITGATVQVLSTTAPPSGGTAFGGYLFTNTSRFGIFPGTGAPTLNAARGSLYLRNDNGTLYVNTDGSTTWGLFPAVDVSGNITSNASLRLLASTATIPAGGNTNLGIYLGPVGQAIAIFYGSGVPTLNAPQGSLYLRSDGSSTSTRMYINTNGTTGWTAVTTAS